MTKPDPSGSAAGQNVLVIDDVASVRESLRIALSAAGHRVTTASNGKEGLDCIAGGAFDVVVTDIWMPDVDGLNFIKRIRASSPTPRIFAITGGGPRLSIESARSLAEVWGAEAVFIKPFDEDRLINAIATRSA